MTEAVRVGNAQAFWGDRGDAAAELLAQREPDLDYLTLDYLAEVSMSILALQRERDPDAGFARDFVDVVRSLAPYWSSGGRCRLIANAGGLNPRGCAEACRAALQEAGCRSLRIGVVTGDDVLEVVRAAAADPSSQKFRNLDSHAAISDVGDRLVTASAYLGAAPIVEALADGADIVITGRVADPSLVVAACMHHFGWTDDDFDRLAGATVAGHLIECGTQVTGGISTDWLDVPDPAHIGFPIVEVLDDGSCIVTKPQGTGGCVTELTVKEQLVYEISDPSNYISPDVTVSFLSLSVEDLGDDRVRVSGARGGPHTEMYKVSATFRDGFRSAGLLTIVGRDAVEKAKRCGELVLQRVREAGFDLRDSVVECLGSGACAAGIVGSQTGRDREDEWQGSLETVLRVAVEADSRHAVERFSRELMPFITAGPQGTTGYAEGRPRVHPVFRYWPCLITRSAVMPRIEMPDSDAQISPLVTGSVREDVRVNSPTTTMAGSRSLLMQRGTATNKRPTALYDIACARSGDKGVNANVGVIARSQVAWELLHTWLTTDRVAEFFSALGVESVERFELPNLSALNFVLRGVLRRSLRTDAQGKSLGQFLLEMPLPADTVLQSVVPTDYGGIPLSELVLVTPLEPGIVSVMLNRPDRRNALSIALLDQLCTEIERLADDHANRVVILCGAEPIFSAGLDLREAADSSLVERSAEAVHRALNLLRETSLIMIAAVQGGAFAGGAGMMAACDIVIATTDTKIGFPEARRGLLPALICGVLKHKVREGDLRELFLAGDVIDATRAQQVGLVQRVVPTDCLLDEALSVARSVAAGGPETIRQTKALLNETFDGTSDDSGVDLIRTHLEARHSVEAREGLAAFETKREPSWL